jgi:hypothetical protein
MSSQMRCPRNPITPNPSHRRLSRPRFCAFANANPDRVMGLSAYELCPCRQGKIAQIAATLDLLRDMSRPSTEIRSLVASLEHLVVGLCTGKAWLSHCSFKD